MQGFAGWDQRGWRSRARSRRHWVLLLAAWACVAAPVRGGVETAAGNGPARPMDSLELPVGVRDPLETVNRGLWAVNRVLLTDAVAPSARVYRRIVPRPFRRGLGNLERHLNFPGRVANHLLEGRWTGARDETGRFLANSIAGFGGLMDPATLWEIPKSDADFSRTFAQWGWQPGCYLMLPVVGPSNEREATGLVADSLANPVSYFTPYSYGLYGLRYNGMTDSVDAADRFLTSELDPYSELEFLHGLSRSGGPPDFRVSEAPDEATLETLGALQFTVKDPEFPNRAKTERIRMPATGRRLPVSVWWQPGRAPVVYLVPGLGSHRLKDMNLALAELYHGAGYTVVVISNPYNYEFIEQAAVAALPGFTPADGSDLLAALTAVDDQLRQSAPRRLGARALVGYSMGGFLALHIAARQGEHPEALQFDRVVAINPPVRLMHGIEQLDAYYHAPLAWPATNRTARLANTLRKVAALNQAPAPPTAAAAAAPAAPPFSAAESKFLIGLSFRFILRDTIFASQENHPLGVLPHPLNEGRRQDRLREAMAYSYSDYIGQFVTPYYHTNGLPGDTRAALTAAGDLRAGEAGLRANPRVRLVLNRNDFLLSPDDLAWLGTVAPAERVRIFDHGGHLGNLAHPVVQRALLDALAGLRPKPQ